MTIGTLLLVMGSAVALGQSAQAQTRPVPKTEAEEITLALSAAPESLRGGAGVWVLDKSGYRKVRETTNGLTCQIDRERADTLEPICWDPEGTATIMPVSHDRAKWRAAGVSDAEIERKVADGFSSGAYRAPRRPGIAYMLSTHNYVFNGERVIHFSPHVMAYAPYLKNADIGSTGTDMTAPWILNEGSPHAYMIIVAK